MVKKKKHIEVTLETHRLVKRVAVEYDSFMDPVVYTGATILLLLKESGAANTLTEAVDLVKDFILEYARKLEL